HPLAYISSTAAANVESYLASSLSQALVLQKTQLEKCCSRHYYTPFCLYLVAGLSRCNTFSKKISLNVRAWNPFGNSWVHILIGSSLILSSPPIACSTFANFKLFNWLKL
ncbi:hypothetical protein VP01_15237g1, partial [Puccinia sorghi]